MSREDPQSTIEHAALRRLLFGVTDCDPEHGDTVIDAAITLVQDYDDLRRRVNELEAVVDTDFDAIAYEQLTKRDKVRRIQEQLVETATTTPTGKAAMDYKEIKWLFNGRPSPGHCYDLMRLAAEEQGFEYQDRTEENSRLTTDLDLVKEPLRFHAANKADE